MINKPWISGSFLWDACTVIDYQNVDALDVLHVFAVHCDLVTVSSLVLSKEVKGLSRKEYEQMGVEILVPTLEQIEEAMTFRGISVIDASSLVLSRDNGMRLVTSDGKLRNRALEMGIHTIRNLRLMILLAEQGLLMATKATKIAGAMARADPYFITPNIVEDFRREIKLVRHPQKDGMVRGKKNVMPK